MVVSRSQSTRSQNATKPLTFFDQVNEKTESERQKEELRQQQQQRRQPILHLQTMFLTGRQLRNHLEAEYDVTSGSGESGISDESLNSDSSRDSDSSHSSRDVRRRDKHTFSTERDEEPLLQMRVRDTVT